MTPQRRDGGRRMGSQRTRSLWPRSTRAALVCAVVLALCCASAADEDSVSPCALPAGQAPAEVCPFCQKHPETCDICGQYCPPHLSYPKKCEAGNYCPEVGVSYVCPEGFFCREGSWQPTKCQPLVVCPEGSQSETKGFAGLLFMFLLALVGYIAVQVYQYCRNKQRERRDKKWNANPIAGRVEQEQEQNNTFKPFLFDLGFKHLFYFVRMGDRQKAVLNNVSGQFLHGRLISIMGPSGAGKTTLLRVLSGRLSSHSSKVKGSILVNGVESSIMKYRSLVGYVPQDDVMLTNLTVKENIRYSALTRLPSHWTRKEKLARANEVINLLELQSVRHVRVGDEHRRGISGGQRKRVNIALEVVANPSIIFLDEPTSGLDSSGARHVMKLLHKLAAIGMTVVCVVHQPRWEIFRLFDDVTLMSTGGLLSYFGPVQEAVDYFVNMGYDKPSYRTNPADFLLDIVSGDLPGPGDRRILEEQTANRRYSLDERSPSMRQLPLPSLGEDTILEEKPHSRHNPSHSSAAAASNPNRYARREKDKGKLFYEMLPRFWLEHTRRKKLNAKAAGAAGGPPRGAARGNGRGGAAPAPRRMSVLRRASRVFQRAPLSLDSKSEPDADHLASIAAADAVVTEELKEERRMPSWFEQFLMFTLRSLNQQLVMIAHLATDLFLVCGSGAILGMVYFDSDEQSDLLQTVSLSCLVVGMTAITSSQRWFSKEVAVFQREQFVGCSASAYFLAKCVAHIPLILLSPAVYLTFYFTFSAPRAALSSYYLVFVLVEMVGTGVGYCVPLLFKGRAQLAGVVFPLICTMFAGVSPDIKALDDMGFFGILAYSLSYARWGVELLYLANAKALDPELFKVPDTLDSLGYSFDHETTGILALLGMAIFFRFLTFLLLMRGKRNARRR